jgi:hypothetical protein
MRSLTDHLDNELSVYRSGQSAFCGQCRPPKQNDRNDTYKAILGSRNNNPWKDNLQGKAYTVPHAMRGFDNMWHSYIGFVERIYYGRKQISSK